MGFWGSSGRGLANGLLPLLGKEMRGRSRNWRFPLALSLYLAFLSGVIMFFLSLIYRMGMVSSQTGFLFYGIIVFGLVLLLAFITATVSATAISGERDRRTYDLLLATTASPTGIVLGKWLASVIYLLFLVVAALPLLAVVYLYGGIPLVALGTAMALCILTGLGYGALGLAYSAVLKRSQAAIIFSLVTVFGLIFVTLVAGGIGAASHGQPGPVPQVVPVQAEHPGWYIYLSPLSAIPAAVPGGLRPVPIMGELVSTLNRLVSAGLTQGGLWVGMDTTMVVAEGFTGWPSWTKFALFQGVLTVVCLLIATLAVNPLPPWRARKIRRRKAEPYC
ncbi:MAG: ABC transporter permease [Bacillota bacterium]